MNLDDWKELLAEYAAKLKRGESLTKQEEDRRDFMEQKMEDWRTDHEVTE